jgi:hypothetical protein
MRMSATRPNPELGHGVDSLASVDRFLRIFDREPTTRDLSVLAATRAALVLRLPARARRRTARIIARL